MSTSASGPDRGEPDEQGTAGGTADAAHPQPPSGEDRPAPAPDTRQEDTRQEDARQEDAPGSIARDPSEQPYPQSPYQQGPSTQGSDRRDKYPQGQPSPYEQPPYQQSAPYEQPPNQQSAPGQAPYAQTPYGQGGYGQGGYGQPYAPQKSRVVAGVLGILLGSLGIHRFYLGFTTIGVIQLLMSTVGAMFTFGLSAIAAGIWGLIEGIMILVGSEQFRRDARGIPLKD